VIAREGRRAPGPGVGHTGAIADLAGVLDTELTARIAASDEAALSEAYRRHAAASRSLAIRLVRDRSLAEEVVQEVFTRLWTRAEQFDGDRGSLRSYLLAQTHGRSLDVVRSESSRRRREAKDALQVRDQHDDVEREVIRNSVVDEVRAALATLPENERAPVELAYLGGLPYREVAIQLGIPEGTAKSRIRSGLSRLRKAMEAANRRD
jgi:RNA polymerase sigma-70 factor (ECF subfamily)